MPELGGLLGCFGPNRTAQRLDFHGAGVPFAHARWSRWLEYAAGWLLAAVFVQFLWLLVEGLMLSVRLPESKTSESYQPEKMPIYDKIELFGSGRWRQQ